MFDILAAAEAVQSAVINAPVATPQPRKRPLPRKRKTPRVPLSVMAAETLMVDPAVGTGAVPLSLAERHYEADLRMRREWKAASYR
jgi:hypothetical protein